MPKSNQNTLEQLAVQFENLYPAIQELMTGLEKIEPGGTLGDEIIIQSKTLGSAFITFSVQPICLIIEHGNRKYVFRTMEI